MPKAEVLAALIIFRLFYLLIPFAMAIVGRAAVRAGAAGAGLARPDTAQGISPVPSPCTCRPRRRRPLPSRPHARADGQHPPSERSIEACGRACGGSPSGSRPCSALAARLLHPLPLCRLRRPSRLSGAAAAVCGGRAAFRGGPRRRSRPSGGDLLTHRRRRRAGALRPGLVPAPRRGRRLRARAPRARRAGSSRSARAIRRASWPARSPTAASATEIACIDPAPRAAIAALGVRHRPGAARRAPIRICSPGSRAGDILFIDSSHVAMPGTDVDRLVLDVLPRLAAGRARPRPRHLPARRLSRPNGPGAATTSSSSSARLLAGRRLRARLREPLRRDAHSRRASPDAVLAELPLLPGAHETSLWLRKL